MRLRVTPQPAAVAEPAMKPQGSRDGVQARGLRLTDRDREVLHHLARHRSLTAPQLARLAFCSTGPRRVRRRLLSLLKAGLIDRLSVVAQPTRGVPATLYTLSRQGAEVVAGDLGGAVRLPALSHRSLRFVAHHVTVCGLHVALVEAIAALNRQAVLGGYAVRQWRHEWELYEADEHGERRPERVSVRDPASGQQRPVAVLPDAFFEITHPHRPSLFFFAEVDMSTHPLRVWRERALVCAAYDARGLFRRRFGGGERESFRVLVVTPPDYRGRSRCANILRAIEQAVGRTDLFWATTADQLGLWGVGKVDDVPPERLLTGAIWRQAGSTERHAILVPTRQAAVRVRPRPALTAEGGAMHGQ